MGAGETLLMLAAVGVSVILILEGAFSLFGMGLIQLHLRRKKWRKDFEQRYGYDPVRGPSDNGV